MTVKKEDIDLKRLPLHVAIIMDGNGRWAKERNRTRSYGHRHGVKTVKEIVKASSELGIKYLTLYTFSTENWKRPKREVGALMDLLVSTIRKELTEIHENNVRIEVVGDMAKLPANTCDEVLKAIEVTRKNSGLTLIMAISYSARWDICQAVKKLIVDAKANVISEEEIDQYCLKNYLSTSRYPDPELLIRTSGEYRISNFLLWELAYTELYFTPKRWPEFSREDFFEAILDYQKRERRFGKTTAQISGK